MPGISLTDPFGPSTVTVFKPKRLCNPADKEHEDPAAPSRPDHLITYDITQTSARFLGFRDVTVINQFGTIHVDLVRPDRLQVPSTKSLSAPPPPPTTPMIDHFKCYRIKRSLGAPIFSKIFGVEVEDQFGTDTLTVLKPIRLCYAANKNNEGILEPGRRLLCYRVNATPRFKQQGLIFTNNQLGPLTNRRVTHVDELCLTSLTIP
jgi:hypothetical protein